MVFDVPVFQRGQTKQFKPSVFRNVLKIDNGRFLIHTMVGCEVKLHIRVKQKQLFDILIDGGYLFQRLLFSRRMMVKDAVVGGTVQKVRLIDLHTAVSGMQNPAGALHALNRRRRLQTITIEQRRIRLLSAQADLRALPIHAQYLPFHGKKRCFLTHPAIMLQKGGRFHISFFFNEPLFTRLRAIVIIAGNAGLIRPFAGQNARMVYIGHRRHGAFHLFYKPVLFCQTIKLRRCLTGQIRRRATINDQKNHPAHKSPPSKTKI